MNEDPSVLATNFDLVKIGEAAQALGVSINTLRRWEELGKISSVRSPGGTRLYSLYNLKKLYSDSLLDFNQKAQRLGMPGKITIEKDKFGQNHFKIVDETLTNSSMGALKFSSLVTKIMLAGLTVTIITSGIIVSGYKISPIQKTGATQSRVIIAQQKEETPTEGGVVLGIASSSYDLIQSVISTIFSPFKFLTQIGTPSNPPQNPSDPRIDLALDKINQIENKVNQNINNTNQRLTSISNLNTYPSNTNAYQLPAEQKVTTQKVTTKRLVSDDAFIGESVIDSYGNVYPARTIINEGSRSSLGTPNNRWFGIYANRFNVDTGGNLTVSGQTTLGTTQDDYIKLIGRISTDIIPSSTGQISLGNGDEYFKNFFVNNITADVGGFARLSAASVISSLIPAVDNTLDLGSSTLRWRNLSIGTDAQVAGNVGIGGSLVVTGNTGVGGSLTVTDLGVFQNGINVTGLSNLTGNVGVGSSLTVNSAAVLNSSLLVLGNSQLSSLTTSGNAGIGGSLTTTGLEFASGGLRVNGLSDLTGNVGVGGSLTVTSGTNLLSYLSVSGSTQLTTLNTSGNAGVGGSLTTTGLQLDSGGLRVNGFSDLTGNVGVGGTATFNNPLSGFYSFGNVGVGASLTVNSAGVFNSSLSVFGNSQISTLTASGNTGIGGSLTTTGLNVASGGLRVNGFSDLTGNVGVGSSLTVSSAGVFNSSLFVLGNSQISTLTASTINTSGNVGVGASLTTTGLAYATGGFRANGYSDLTGNVGVGSSLTVTSLTTLNTVRVTNISRLTGNVGIGNNADTSLNNLQVSGTVGIGTSNTPGSYKLDVAGLVRATGYNGTCTTTLPTQGVGCNQDVAEIYASSETVEPGDVLALDTGLDKGVKKSNGAYDNKLMGIVSSAPGLLLGINGEQVALGGEANDYPKKADPKLPAVALTGKVPTKVSSENGTIEIGDYLTSSSVAGVAMKASKPGPTVGKALESYSDTDPTHIGKIFVFINISFADPNNFLSSLSMDSDGNLIIPKIKTASVILDSSVASASAQLTADSGQIALNSDPNYVSTPPQTATGTTTFYDLTGKIASLEDKLSSQDTRIKQLEQVAGVATVSAQLAGQSTSSSSALPDLTPSPAKTVLTNADILFASASAQLANLNTYSDATVSGMLKAYKTEIQDNLKVFGQSSLSNTVVAGNLSQDGTLSIENGSEINVVGTLFLQKSSLAESLDIFGGKVTVDKDGNVKTSGEVAAASISTNKLTIANSPIASSSASISPTIGSAKIPADQSGVVVNTSQVTNTSKIFVTPRTKIGSQALVVDSITPGENFTVSLDHAIGTDVDFDWWIVETK